MTRVGILHDDEYESSGERYTLDGGYNLIFREFACGRRAVALTEEKQSSLIMLENGKRLARSPSFLNCRGWGIWCRCSEVRMPIGRPDGRRIRRLVECWMYVSPSHCLSLTIPSSPTDPSRTSALAIVPNPSLPLPALHHPPPHKRYILWPLPHLASSHPTRRC